MATRNCGKINTNGTTCGMAALKGKALCYYHQRERQRFDAVQCSSDKRRRAQAAPTPDPEMIQDISEDLFVRLQLPALDDAASIQVCYTMVLQAAATGQISRRMAGTMFYGLFLAKQNLDAARADLRQANYKDAVESDPSPIFTGDPTLDADHTPIEQHPDFARYFKRKDSPTDKNSVAGTATTETRSHTEADDAMGSARPGGPSEDCPGRKAWVIGGKKIPSPVGATLPAPVKGDGFSHPVPATKHPLPPR